MSSAASEALAQAASASSSSTANSDALVNAASKGTALVVLDFVVLWAWRLSLGVLGVAVLAGSLLYVKQESLLYLPSIPNLPRPTHSNPQGLRNPGERGITHWYNVQNLATADQAHIHAWFLVHPAALQQSSKKKLPTLLFFHGNAGNIGLRLPNAVQMMQQLSCHVLLVEYRGYGDSDDTPPTEAGLKRDAQAAYEWLADPNKPRPGLQVTPSSTATQERSVSHFVDPSQLYVFGRSLGGAVAFSLAHHVSQQRQQQDDSKLPPLAGLIVENTFVHISAMVDQLFPLLKSIKRWVLRMDWNSQAICSTLHDTPILFLAGARDELVPHAHMQTLYQTSLLAGNLRTRLHVVPAGTHNETWLKGGAAYWQAIASFLRETTSSATTTTKTSIKTANGSSKADDESAATIPIMSQNLFDLAKNAVSSQQQQQSKPPPPPQDADDKKKK